MINDSLLAQLYPAGKRKQIAHLLETTPYVVKPIITQSDVTSKYIHRYFIRPVSDKTNIMEVQYRQYKQNPIYIVADVKWKIIGQKETVITSGGARIPGVRDTNIQSVSVADLTFGGLSRYITNYLEFWYDEG
jgi:hypothetical protein